MSSAKRRKLEHSSDEEAASAAAADATVAADESLSDDEHQPDESEDCASFSELGVIESLCEACDALGYKKPTPIQAKAIPPALNGQDIIGLAETGSGKTAAFAIPMLQALMDKPQAFFGLVLAPTRELADQIRKSFEALGSVINVKVALLVGGLDMMPQAIALGKKPHVVVATPGRLLDHLENTKGFSLRSLKALVLDEADRMLDLDFKAILDKILQVIPRDNRHTSLFSATMSSRIESLQRASLRNPLKVSVSSPSASRTVATLKQSFAFFPHKEKDMLLVHLLNEHAGRTVIVFARTVHGTQRLALLLRALGFQAIPLHGRLTQTARLGALNKFRSRGRSILVSTDVAARGLDIQGVDLVVNFDLPGDSKTYIHRVGRTARAGRSGKAVSLVSQYDVEVWQRIEHALGGRQLPEEPLDRDEVLVLADSVSKAQRTAVRQLKDMEEDGGRGGKGSKGGISRVRGRGKGKGNSRDHMDTEEV